ncbi:cilia- and flagella-associated protein 65 isoform 2-T2 [Spinachia spinachia]
MVVTFESYCKPLSTWPSAMLAEARGPEPSPSRAPWNPSTPAQDSKDSQIHPRQRGGKNRGKASSQRSCLFGLELNPELVWEDWELGREFTKTLVLKNIHSKLQKLHVRPPVSKFFATITPQIVVLSPGTSFSMPICFRPLQRCEYEDCIEFDGKDGSFQVCLRAIIPCHALEVPDSVLLPICAVQNSSKTKFLLKNVSKLQTHFQWKCTAPFQLSPEQGLLKPSQECPITAIFRPQEALVYQKQASCKFGDEGDEAKSCCKVLLQGLAKYPFIQLRDPGTTDEKEQCGPELHFGSLPIGQSLQKPIEVFNPSPVTASFSLSRSSSEIHLLDSEFSCDVTEGKVAAGGSLRALVTYTPAEVDTVSVEYLSLKCSGALNETPLKLIGNCVGPNVSLTSSVLDFGCVEEGGAVVQTVELVNSAPVEAFYQWDLDCAGNSVFSIQPASGTVCPHSRITLQAVYKPTQPLPHHRRVTCIILHRDPIFLDLIGTCHSELRQPVTLKPEHLVLYKLCWYRRLNPQDTLTAVQQQNKGSFDREGMLWPEGEQSDHAQDKRTPMEEYYESCLGCMDPLSWSSLSSPPISVEPSELQFNQVVASSLSTTSTSSQPVSITNYTTGKLRLVWTATPESPFTVSPSSCDLAPLKSTSFRVTYDPKQLNTLHGVQLECFAYYKDSPQVEGCLLCPPWCVTVRVIGHSFQQGKEHFMPRCSLQPSRVVFPALGVLSYRTALFRNCGDLPLSFRLDHSSTPALAESVSVVPSCGLIQPGKHQILTLRTTPSEDGPKQGFSLHLQLNAAKDTKKLTVVSVVEKLCISLEGDNRLHFQPTAVGSRTRRSHHIRNLCRVPLRFQWSIPEPDQELICVEPDAGELHPNESSVQIWSFSPLCEKSYTLTPTLSFWPIQTPGCNESQLTLEVVGLGSKGLIEAEKTVVDVGDILVGSCQVIQVPLVNNSPCPVSFCLSVQQMLLDEDLTYDPGTEPKALRFDCERETIVSHSKVLLRSTVRPHRRAQYLWTISCQMLNSSGIVCSPPRAVCEVRAKSVFPTLRVIDVCGGGSVGRLSKVHLWKLFSLDSLNEHMRSNTSPAGLAYRTTTRNSLSSSPSVFAKATLDCNFSANPMNSKSSVFVLMFHNPGSIPVDWAFLFPADQKLEMEYWAETAQFSSTELSQMKVEDNHLFVISPRSGTLLPGQQRAVQFTYSHDFVGTDRFPVTLKLYGREILLNLEGLTLEKDTPCLHFASRQHVFTSVSIEDCTPPKQVYELNNCGAVPLRYEVDVTALAQLQVDNFNHPVLVCLNPEGEVLPGKTAMLEWIFSPLEAKVYHMDVSISVQGGDSTLVRFEGCGFDSPTLASTKPFKCSDTEASEPCVKRGPFPGQVVFLSEDSVSLGSIPVCSRSSRIFFLTNLSHTDSVHYKWDEQSCQQVVQIRPEKGVLCPEESALCVLTFTSTDYPTCYQLDVTCQMIQENALTQHRDALQSWEEEKERRQNDFTLTDKNLTEKQGVLMEEEPVSVPVEQRPPLRKYKTLPPIFFRSCCETVGSICTKMTKAERGAQRETAKSLRRPEPPQPALLHLGLTAHSRRPVEYLARLPEQHRRFQAVRPRQPEGTSCPAGPLSTTHGLERDLTMHVLTSLLRDILEDPAFIFSLNALSPRPIIYQLLPPAPDSPTFSQLAPDPQILSGGTGQQKEQRDTADSEGAAGRWRDNSPTQSTVLAEHAPADLSEDVLLNTLQNLMMEAVRGELILTAHPRAVTLPPVCTSRKMSKAMARSEKTERMKRNLQGHKSQRPANIPFPLR